VTVCPHCGLEKGEGPKYYGHLSYCKQHPESRPKKEPERPKAARSETSTSTSTGKSTSATTTVPTTTTTGSTATLQPVTFSFEQGEKLPSQQEIPEFKSPEQEKKEAEQGKPETVKATLAEERKAGVSAIAALILPLFDMANSALAGESIQLDKDKLKLNAQDAEMLAQAVILVDQKHGGPISKTLGSEEYGAEIFLAGVCIGLGIKVTMMLRMRQSRRPMRPSAAPSPEEIPREREKTPLEKVGESFKNLVIPKKPERKEEQKPEGVLSQDDFMAEAQRRIDLAASQ
jgi:hypothetical protein